MRFIFLFVLSLPLFLGLSKAQETSEPTNSSKPIKIVLNNWDSQKVLSHVTANLLEKLGYKVEYVPSDFHNQWGYLRFGDAHLQIEVWQGTMGNEFERMVKHDLVEDMGTHKAKTREEWWYPLYVEELCPGLPNWKALNDCAHIFKTNESGDKGEYVTGPWEKQDGLRIRSLNLNFKIKQLSEPSLWKHLETKIALKKPLLIFNWTPNWVEAKYPGKFVEFPEYTPECEEQASWGVNQNEVLDCGSPKDGWLKKAAWPGLKQTWPCAYSLLSNMNLTNKHISEASYIMRSDNLTPYLAAQIWMDRFKDDWQSWIPNECR